MSKPKNDVATVPLTLSTTEAVIEELRRFAKTGLYGKNPAEVAEGMLREALRREVREEGERVLPPKPKRR